MTSSESENSGCTWLCGFRASAPEDVAAELAAFNKDDIDIVERCNEK